MKSAFHKGLCENPASQSANSTPGVFVRRSKPHLWDPLGFIPIPQAQQLPDFFLGQIFPTVSSPKGFGHNNLLPLVLMGSGKSLYPFVLAAEFSQFSISALKFHCARSSLQSLRSRWEQKYPQCKWFSCWNPTGNSGKSSFTAGLWWGFSHGSVLAAFSPGAERFLSSQQEVLKFNSLGNESLGNYSVFPNSSMVLLRAVMAQEMFNIGGFPCSQQLQGSA